MSCPNTYLTLVIVLLFCIIKTTLGHFSNPIFQRVFNRDPSTSLAEAFLGSQHHHHHHQHNQEHQEQNFYHIPVAIPEDYQEEVEPVVVEEPQETVTETNQNSYQGFNLLPFYEKTAQFNSAQPHEELVVVPEGYNQFRLLPYYELLTKFSEKVPTSQEIIVEEEQEVSQPYSGFKLLPFYTSPGKFREVTAPFTSNLQPAHISTFKLLPTYELQPFKDKETLSTSRPILQPTPVFSQFKLLPDFERYEQFNPAQQTFTGQVIPGRKVLIGIRKKQRKIVDLARNDVETVEDFNRNNFGQRIGGFRNVGEIPLEPHGVFDASPRVVTDSYGTLVRKF